MCWRVHLKRDIWKITSYIPMPVDCIETARRMKLSYPELPTQIGSASALPLLALAYSCWSCSNCWKFQVPAWLGKPYKYTCGSYTTPNDPNVVCSTSWHRCKLAADSRRGAVATKSKSAELRCPITTTCLLINWVLVNHSTCKHATCACEQIYDIGLTDL